MINAASILAVITPELVETCPSEYHGEIEVYRLRDQYSLSVRDLTQSGGMVKTIWDHVLGQVGNQVFSNRPPKKVLVLGLGGGSLIPLLTRRWPAVSITALEIDPIMISLAARYFGIKPSDQLTIIKADAFAWVQQASDQFDLIVVDLYQGESLPPQAEKEAFFQQLRHLLRPAGAVVVNYLVLQGMKPQAVRYQHNLTRIFPHLKRLHTPANWVFLAQLSSFSPVKKDHSRPSQPRKKPLK